VAGRLRSIPVAFAGGMLLGVIQNLVAGYATFAQKIPGFSASVPPMLLVVFLIFIGKDKVRAAGTALERRPARAHHEDMADLSPLRRRLPWMIFVVLLLVYIFILANSFWIALVAQGLALALVFLSFKVVTGIGGMVSLAQATFVTMSGLVAGVLFHHGWPFLPALIVATLASVALGMIVVMPSLRLGGIFLALATLALGLVSERILFTWTALSNKLNAGWTVPRPKLGPIDLKDTRSFAVFMLVLVGLVVLLVRNLERSSSGRAMAAVSSSETAATASGVSVIRTKLTLFAISSAIAGVGGVFLASYRGGSNAAAFPATAGLTWLAVMVLFGINRSAAALIAGLVTACSPVILSDGFHWPLFIPTFLDWNGTHSVWISQLLFGMGAVQMARHPDGGLAITARQNFERRMKRRAKAAARAAGVPLDDQPTFAATVAEPTAAGTSAAAVAAASLSADAILAVEGLHASYGEVEVLHGVTFELATHSSMALLGPNGAGKSTLVGVLSGHLPATAGSVRLLGGNITDVPAYKRPQLGLLISPESRGIFPSLSVEDNLAVWLPNAADRAKALERFPALADRRHVAAANLSGGEQQMLAMAPVVVRPPKVLVADEPTLGLAPLVADQVMALLLQLAADGVAILVIEEKAERVLAIADHVAVIERGNIVWIGRPSDTDSEQLAAAYLGGV
jgi:ABC-type branched-subunit amino acid transport system ATPase component/ABC-type branched-subunit amino acid transport system permease subunit